MKKYQARKTALKSVTGGAALEMWGQVPDMVLIKHYEVLREGAARAFART